ncbi:hypothetical protein QBC44DRAFT_374467 [Cladorrhinum sp. PSN332]|nr:hypothetical protein QBC44DRAFT_374467 [Cladorrhinum sp. PSN332]
MSDDQLNGNGIVRLTVQVVCSFVAVVATALRFWCKFRTKQGIHADDWFILATTVSYLSAVSSTIWGLFAGSKGKEISEIAADLMAAPSAEKVTRMENYLESLVICYILFLLTFYLAKIAILLLYRRIFSTQQFRRMCWILMGVSTAFFIAAQVTIFVICIPFNLFWQRTRPVPPGGRCLNFDLYSLVVGTMDTVLDVAILVLPVRAVLSLQMPVKTKALLCGIFLLGGFAIITSILRVYYMHQLNETYVNFRETEFFLNIHAATVILCACLPIYTPLRILAGALLARLRDGCRSSVRRLLQITGGTAKSREKIDDHADESAFSQLESGRNIEMKPGCTKGSAK